MNVDTAYYAPVEWVDGMPDMNWLSTQQAGALDPARRRDGQGEHGHRLARAAGVGGEAPDSSTIRSRSIRCSIRSTCTASGCSWCRATACRRGTSSGRTRRSFPVGSTVDLLIDASNPGSVDAALPHRRAPRRGDDDGAARRPAGTLQVGGAPAGRMARAGRTHRAREAAGPACRGNRSSTYSASESRRPLVTQRSPSVSARAGESIHG